MVGSCSRVIRSTARLWDAPAPLPDDLPRLAAWVEAATGLELDERGSIRVLDGDAWLDRRRRLEQLGGRRRRTRRRGWTRSSSEPIRRRGATPGSSGASGTGPRPPTPRRPAPDRSTSRSGTPWPACTSSAAIPTGPRRRSPRPSGGSPMTCASASTAAQALLWSGDRAGWRRAIAALLDRFGGDEQRQDGQQVAWACALGPDATADPEVPVRLAEAAVRGAAPESCKSRLLEHARGRAAPRRPVRRGDPPARGRHPAPGRGGSARGLGVPGDGPPPPGASRRGPPLARPAAGLSAEHGPVSVLVELEIRLLRSEAEAVVVYDPAFPDDPFAR